MSAWGKVPWTLWAYALIMVGEVVRFLLRVHGTRAVLIIGFVALMVAWTFFLLKGVRWLWIATLAVFLFGFLQTIILGPRTWWSLSSLITIALLIAPPTRRYFAKQERLAHAE